MSELTNNKKSLFPAWANELFKPLPFVSSRMTDFNRDWPYWDFEQKMPSVNITETEKEFQIELAAPGLERKDFKVVAEHGMLTISSEKEEERSEEEKNYTRKEYSYNSFSRSFTLPENCMEDQISAKYDKGILHIVLPKKEVTVTKPVKEIKVS
jgi:HSP20 family protein